MKKSQKIFIGIDVSKSKLDYCIVTDPTSNKHDFGIVSNDEKGIKKLMGTVAAINKQNDDVLYCFENTGVYSMPLCYWLQAGNFPYWIEAALQIKRAKGISRGKSDKADSKEIAFYAITHLHLYKPTQLPEKCFIELKLLLAEREKLIKSIRAFMTTGENKTFLPAEVLKKVLAHNKKTLTVLKKQLIAIEKLIKEIINNNETIREQEKLLLSIPGVGNQTAINLIVTTHGFTRFKDWRKFACYCGVAPFEYSSGSSIKGKTKVSHLANKKLKSLLNMAALSAKKNDTEMKEYFERKVGEGKNKMLVMNALRCKIISRSFAVIARKSPFVNMQKFKEAS